MPRSVAWFICRAMRRVRNTRARVALEEWFAGDSSRSQTRLAEQLGVKQALVSQWLAGVARPSPRLRHALEAVCGIPVAEWLDASEAAGVARLRREEVSNG